MGKIEDFYESQEKERLQHGALAYNTYCKVIGEIISAILQKSEGGFVTEEFTWITLPGISGRCVAWQIGSYEAERGCDPLVRYYLLSTGDIYERKYSYAQIPLSRASNETQKQGTDFLTVERIYKGIIKLTDTFQISLIDNWTI